MAQMRHNRNSECNWDRRPAPEKREKAEVRTGEVFTFKNDLGKRGLGRGLPTG
jgi:hypothetical protein